MKNGKHLMVLSGILLAFALALTGCEGDNGPDPDNEPPVPAPTDVTITFDLGYEGATPPSPITVREGRAAGTRWPANPVRGLGYTFDGWFSDGVKYTSQTVINNDVTVTARWSDEFPVTGQPSKETVEALFSAAGGFPDALSNSWKVFGHHNALITQGFGADPTAFEYEGRLYIFASNDTILYDSNNQIANGGYNAGIQGLRALSSGDMVNWTDHGVLNIAGPASTNPLIPVSDPIISPETYAVASWAPSAVWTEIAGKPQFFIYYANSGNGIGVVTANSPTGPWYSPIDELLISRNTPNCSTDDVPSLFDPGAMIDDDGTGYLYFGGGQRNHASINGGRRVRLGPDMTSIVGTPETFESPHLFEDSEIAKFNGRYYYSYVLNSSATGGLFNTQIAYRTSDEPMGEFSAPTGIMRAANNQLSSDDNNNHHCLFKFKDNYYVAYHASRVKYAFGANKNAGYYRSTHIDNVTINESTGVISTITMTSQGVEQVGKLNPYVLNEAETIGIMGGVFTRADEKAGGGMVVTSIDSGDWVALYGVDFGSTGAKKFTARVRTPETPADYAGAIEIRLDPTKTGPATGINNISTTNTASITGGEPVGRLYIKADEGKAGQYASITVDLDKTVTGVHDLVFVFYSSLGADPITPSNYFASQHTKSFEFDRWQFE